MANEARIRAYGLPTLTLDANLGAAGTSISAPELAYWPVVTSTAHMPLWVNVAQTDYSGSFRRYLVYITAHTSAATTATIASAPENPVTRYDVLTGAKCWTGSTRRDSIHQPAPYFYNNASDLSIQSNAAWGNLNTIDTALDLSVECYPGDIVLYSPSFRVDSQAVGVGFDVWSNPDDATNKLSWGSNGAPNNSHLGIMGWFAQASLVVDIGPSVARRITSAEIDTGVLKCRMKMRSSSATNRTLQVASGNGFQFQVSLRNLGPVDEKPTF